MHSCLSVGSVATTEAVVTLISEKAGVVVISDRGRRTPIDGGFLSPPIAATSKVSVE